VNLIGDHTDYNEGLALPMAIDLSTEVTFIPDESERITVISGVSPEPATFSVELPVDRDVIAAAVPAWARMAAGITVQVRPSTGGTVHASSTVPTAAGLSSSASFCVALALSLGWEAEPRVTAVLCQRAESLAGSDVGLMDPLVIAAAKAGTSLMVDFATVTWRPVTVPPAAAVVVVDSGERRSLTSTAYKARRAECDAAAIELKAPLGRAEEADLPGLLDPVLRKRTRHVVRECERVRAMGRALEAGDLRSAGNLMLESHRSLAGDFEVSTPRLDALVHELTAIPGVHGARLTGAGFGGCVVALSEHGAVDPGRWPGRCWIVAPSDGAAVVGPRPSG
jgi:galactokinase